VAAQARPTTERKVRGTGLLAQPGGMVAADGEDTERAVLVGADGHLADPTTQARPAGEGRNLRGLRNQLGEASGRANGKDVQVAVDVLGHRYLADPAAQARPGTEGEVGRTILLAAPDGVVAADTEDHQRAVLVGAHRDLLDDPTQARPAGEGPARTGLGL